MHLHIVHVVTVDVCMHEDDVIINYKFTCRMIYFVVSCVSITWSRLSLKNNSSMHRRRSRCILYRKQKQLISHLFFAQILMHIVIFYFIYAFDQGNTKVDLDEEQQTTKTIKILIEMQFFSYARMCALCVISTVSAAGKHLHANIISKCIRFQVRMICTNWRRDLFMLIFILHNAMWLRVHRQ